MMSSTDKTHPTSPAAAMATSDDTPLRTSADGDDAKPSLDITSSLRTEEALKEICQKYSVPAGFTPLLAGDLSMHAPPPPGSVCVHVAALDGGMRLPLHPFFVAVLRQFGIAPGQLTPFAWRTMAGFVALSDAAGVEPSLAVFRHFFSLRQCPAKHIHTLSGGECQVKHYYTLSGMEGDGLLFSRKPLKVKRWKEDFFFLRSPAPWPCPVQWGEVSWGAIRNPTLTRGQKDMADSLLHARGPSPLDLHAYLLESNMVASKSSQPRARQGKLASVKIEPCCKRIVRSCKPVIGKKRKLAGGDANGGTSALPSGSKEADRKATKQLLQSLAVPSSNMSLLETAKHVASSLGYALDLEDKLCEANAELAKAKEAAEKPKAEADALRAELDCVKAEHAKMKVAAEAVKDLRTELHKVLSELAVAQAAAEAVKAERWRDAELVGVLQVYLAKVKAELAETKAAEGRAVAEADAQLTKVKAELAESKAAEVRAVDEADALRAELGKVYDEVNEMKAATAAAKAERERAVAAADALREEVGKMNAELAMANAALKTARAERDHDFIEAYARQLELGSVKADLADAKAAGEHAAAVAYGLRAELDKANAHIMETQLAAVTANAETKRAVAEADALRVELSKMKAEAAQTSSAMKTVQAERDHNSAKADALQVELGRVKAELEEVKAAGDRAVGTADALQLELGNIKSHLAETETAAATAKAQQERAAAEADALRLELGNVKTELAATKGAAVRVNTERVHAAAKADALRVEVGNYKAVLDEMQMELNILNNELAGTLDAVEAAKTAAVREFMGSKKYARELSDSEMEGYERGLEDMKRAALCSYPKLDPARLVVPIHTGLLGPGARTPVPP